MTLHDLRRTPRCLRSGSVAGAAMMLVALSLAFTGDASAETKRAAKAGTLAVRVTGFEHDRGQVIAKLFRRGDDVPRGKGFRKLALRIEKRRATLKFTNLPYGTYAIFLFHDENGNGTVDHNFLGMPTEPLGFSNGFSVSLFSGIPDFDDLKFQFVRNSKPLTIAVE